MTREEAIENIKLLIWTDNYPKDFEDALRMAIEALQSQIDGDVISRKDAIDELDEFIKPFVGLIGDMGAAINGAREVIKDVPSAEVRLKGEWIESDIGWKCSECNYGVKPWNHTNFCPNCGSDMRGEKNG